MPEIDNYQLEDDAEGAEVKSSEDNPRQPNRPAPPMNLLIKLLLTPAEGWKQLRRSRIKAENFAAATLYPIAGAAAIAQFIGLLYTPTNGHSSVIQLLTKGLITFMSFFFGNFLSLALCRILLPKSARSFSDTDFGKSFIVAMLSTLAIFYLLITLLPMLETILVFLPLWTIYLISKGGRYLKVDAEKRTTAIGMLCIIIVGTPMLIAWLFSVILPPL